MQIPNIEVTIHSDRPAVGWEDATRRYHIWLDDSGQPQDDTIHANLIMKPNKRGDLGHRAHSQTAKRWAPLVSAIVDKVKADALVAKARERADAKEAAENAARIKKANDEAIALLDRAAWRLPPAVATMVRTLPEATKLAFVSAFY